MKENILTVPQREALDRYLSTGLVMVNQKRDGFENFKAKDAVALLIAGVAKIEDGELKLTNLGELLT